MSETTYLVTARKYRPLLFKDVVAQEHVTETLKNAIRLDRLAHAYLFTGPRGVGKTTAARIVAKAINCTTPIEDREDRAEPCRECVSCKSFEEGRNLNIIEIDAASNNKVDDVRDLRETVRIPPQNNRMKVYIIDEVHMLSNAAFNALLKTLEEPPPHAMFIFATTEPHKVLPTIQSRCQRFDFRRISISETIGRLRLVCSEENIQADEASFMLMARKGDGALRDALSVFDQAVSLCGIDIHHVELVKALGVVDSDLYFDVTDAVQTGDGASMLLIVERIMRSGYDLQEFVDGLAEHLRNFLVALTVRNLDLIEATDAGRKKIEASSAAFTESVLLSLVHTVSELAFTLRSARQPRLALEMALLRMSNMPSSVDIRSALEKLNNLEKMAAGGEIKFVTQKSAPSAPAAPPLVTPSPQSVAEPAPAEVVIPAPTENQPALTVDEPAPSLDLVETDTVAQEAPATETEAVLDTDPEDNIEVSGMEEEPVGSQPMSPAPAAVAPAPALETSTEEQHTVQPSGPSLFGEAPAIKKTRPRPENSAALEQEADVLVMEEDVDLEIDEDDLQLLKDSWNEIVEEVMSSEKQLGSFLKHAEVFAFEGKVIILAVPDEFHAKALRSDRAKLAHRLTERSGIHVEKIGFRVEAVASEDDEHSDDEASSRELLDKMCEENPAVRALVERFGGEIVW